MQIKKVILTLVAILLVVTSYKPVSYTHLDVYKRQALLPTTITQSEEVLTNAVANVAKVVEKGYEGAEVLGIHFEGPYLDMIYKGAQPEQHIVKPTIEQFKKYQKAANGLSLIHILSIILILPFYFYL